MTTTRHIKFVLPPTAPLRYKTAAFSINTKVIDVLNKLTDLCHFVNFAESGYGLYLPKGHGSTRGKWLDDDKLLSDYPNQIEESLELRKKPGFRSNPTSPSSPGAIPEKEGNALRYSPLTRLWTPCVLRLYTHKLAVGSSEHDNNPDLILLGNVTKVDKATEKKYAFFVAVEDTKSTFRCKNNSDMLEWIRLIGESVIEVNPDFDFKPSDFLPISSPRARGSSFLNILTREDTNLTPLDVNNNNLSPRALSPREERKKYSFLTLRNKKSSKDKDPSLFSLRSSKGAEKEGKEKEKETKETKETKGGRKKFGTLSTPSSPTRPSINFFSSSSLYSPSSPSSPPITPPLSPDSDFPYLDDDDNGVRARSHSTSTTHIPTIPTIQSLLTAKRISTNEAEIHMLRDKLQHQTEHARLVEQKYQNLLLKYTEQANKSSLKNTTGPLVDVSVSPPSPGGNSLTTSLSLPSFEADQYLNFYFKLIIWATLRKSGSMLWRWSKKSEPEVLELKLELQQLKAENRVMKLQLDRRADRDSKSFSGSKPSSERKRTSPRSRRQLREGLEKEKSMGRIEVNRSRRESGNLSLSSSTSESDLFGLSNSGGIRNRSESEALPNRGGLEHSASLRGRSESVQEEASDVFLRDSIRHDYSVPLVPIRSYASQDFAEARSKSGTSVGGTGMSDIDNLQKEMVNLRERLLEQQQLFRREENNRLHIEREYRKAHQTDDNSLLDMESIARLLQQSLLQLKQKLEDDFGDYSDEEEESDA